MSARLAELRLADGGERWAALGFGVHAEACRLGGVLLRFGRGAHGITSWAIDGIEPLGEIDGLATDLAPVSADPGETNPNRAVGVDHVVVVTPAFDRTAAALAAAGMPLRRIRDGGRFRQGFRRLGPAILEVVDASGAEAGPARFWGLVVIVEDLNLLADSLGDRLGAIRPAVQPGRQIATLRDSAGLSQKVAFMTPEPR